MFFILDNYNYLLATLNLQDLNSWGMNGVKRKITTESLHKDSNCFLLLVIRLAILLNINFGTMKTREVEGCNQQSGKNDGIAFLLKILLCVCQFLVRATS